MTAEAWIVPCRECGERRVSDQACQRCKAQRLVEAFADLPSLKALIGELKTSLSTYVERAEFARRDKEHRRLLGQANADLALLRSVAKAAKAFAFEAILDEDDVRTAELHEQLTNALNLIAVPPIKSPSLPISDRDLMTKPAGTQGKTP